MNSLNRTLASVAVLTILSATTASAALITNGIPVGTAGHWSVDVLVAGESRAANLTANRLASGDVFTEDVLFDYFTYVDFGTGGVRLSDTAIGGVNVVGNTATSSGGFVGSNGVVLWSVESTIAPGGSVFESTFTFETDGALGDLDVYQYLDEDIESVSDDVFFTRGSVGGLDLELFTIDDSEVYGVSHSGALDGSQGLVNAQFTGWAADEYNNIKPRILAGTQLVSLAGVIDNLPAYNHPQVGAAYGPEDIVSVMRWSLDPDADMATIITTLGGVPDGGNIPSAPEPGSVALLVLGIAGLAANRRRSH